jgi:hypothetical protein
VLKQVFQARLFGIKIFEEKWLYLACEKYSASAALMPSYFMAYYYHGRALHSLAKMKKKDSEGSYFHSGIILPIKSSK